MKKIFLLLCLMFFCVNVNASILKGRVNYNNVNLRSGPGTGYSSIKKLAINSEYTLLSNNKYANEGGCSSGWYKIKYNNSEGYVCSDYFDLFSEEDQLEEASTECETTLKNAGFPKSYWSSLCALKATYPNWNFVVDKSGIDWNTIVEKESVVGKSLIQTSYQGYLSTDVGAYDYLTDTFVVREGSNWYSANAKTVAYYLDPRNFLNERYIFMFEKLSYDPSYQTREAVSQVLNGRDIVEHVDTIIKAGSDYNVNAIFIASKIRQETGGNYTNTSLAGNAVTVDGNYYEHIYNPYNIGAYTGANQGLLWAASGNTYLRPWTNIPNAILGGADVISSTYIGIGQDTIYFQKFNSSSYAYHNAFSHQYMTNVKASASESSISYGSYSSMDLLSSTAYTFVIPVYENMPEEISTLPNTGNPNNHLSDLKINGETISGFSHDVYSYNYYVSKSVKNINITLTKINSNATVEGAGVITLKDTDEVLSIKVIAENGDVQNYTINIKKTESTDISVNDLVSSLGNPISDNYMMFKVGMNLNNLKDKVYQTSTSADVSITSGNTGNIKTGETISFKLGSDEVSYTAVVKGDVSGDGNINITDLLKVQKHILNYATVSGSYEKAADTNQDGKIDIVDLLRVQKHILGYLTIE